jgi:hypothetical protein
VKYTYDITDEGGKLIGVLKTKRPLTPIQEVAMGYAFAATGIEEA